jgi:hypothetical protein
MSLPSDEAAMNINSFMHYSFHSLLACQGQGGMEEAAIRRDFDVMPCTS